MRLIQGGKIYWISSIRRR